MKLLSQRWTRQLTALWITSLVQLVHAQNPMTVLWSIGKDDNSDAEFALAPGGYKNYNHDGVFVVGHTKASVSWPYVQPGPMDSWAGARTHTFRIFYGLNHTPQSSCRLLIHLLDTQDSSPPVVNVSAGTYHKLFHLPPGSGDATVFGTAKTGKQTTISLNIPANALHSGENEIAITSTAGSWMIYDSVQFEAPGSVQLQGLPALGVINVRSSPWIRKPLAGGRPVQTVNVTTWNYSPVTTATVLLEGKRAHVTVQQGISIIPVDMPLVSKAHKAHLVMKADGFDITSQPFMVSPVRHWVVYLIPHSHVDIGYTDLQANVRKKQINNLLQAMQLIQSSNSYPSGSRFIWNLEVIWPIDSYLLEASQAERSAFFHDVKNGSLGLDAYYGNLLTGLCTATELLHAFDDSLSIAHEAGVKLDAGMQDDVPGNTWGNVSALAQAGVKYLSLGPNPGDRMGQSLIRWQDKPFYWETESGKHKVLVWMTHGGYSLGVSLGGNLISFLPGYLNGLQQGGYPYDIACLQWLTTGDNGSPDVNIAKTVRAWNAKYLSPKIVISKTDTAFKALASRYSTRIPTYRGDFTPYWEDGAGTSALETSLNRNAAARLQQAEALWTMTQPSPFPAALFHRAWDNTILYSEHTWGAWDSTSDPNRRFVKSQWQVKKAYAVNADSESRKLLALAARYSTNGSHIAVYNTESWSRSQVIMLPADESTEGDMVVNSSGIPVPSQRLSNGKLAFMAMNVPPFGSRVFTVQGGKAYAVGNASAFANQLDNGLLQAFINPQTGAISSISMSLNGGPREEFVKYGGKSQVNSYFYLLGGNLKHLQTNGSPTITVLDRGPLVGSIRITSKAPGCNSLTRTVTIYSGEPVLYLEDTVDKKKVLAYEGVHFGFSFNIPDPVMRMDMPLSVIQPGIDQLPASCMNWYPVQHWVDMSNSQYGVTWATRDAPLVEDGGITATLPGNVPPFDPRWIQHISSSSTLYSWVMNNHWHTNYRAYQYGPVTFRYALRPHWKWTPDAMARFGLGFSHPLIAVPAEGTMTIKPMLQLSSRAVVVRELVPAADGHGAIVRLWGASGKAVTVRLTWRGQPLSHCWLSNTQQQRLARVGPEVTVPGYGLVTLRLP